MNESANKQDVGQLIVEHRPKLKAFIRKQVRNSEDAEDILQEIFELTELDGILVKDISKTTGIAVNTLLSRKHYAVLHLRKRMRRLYEDIIIA